MLQRTPLEKTWRLIRDFEEAVDENAIDLILKKITKPLGLTSLFSGIVPPRVLPMKDVLRRILVQRFPDEWADRYNRKGYVFRDPIVERLQFDDKPFTWNDAYASSTSPDNVELIRGESAEFGLRGGFVVPVALLDGAIATVSFGGEVVDLSPDDRSLLGFVANYAVGQLLHRRCSSLHARGRMTARKYDCLSWAAEGKTDWEISVILGISKPTVTKHIMSVRQKLGAVTKAHAVAIALREKIIR